MKPSDIIVRRATDELQSLYAGTGVMGLSQVEVDQYTLRSLLRYLDELHARGVLPKPLNPTEPWPAATTEAAGPVPPEAG